MTALGLPAPMFWVFVATIVAGSLGAIHYLVAHVILKRPFAEIPPPVVREGRLGDATGGDGEPGAGGADPGGDR